MAKALPEGLRVMGEGAYESELTPSDLSPIPPFFPLTSVQRFSFIKELTEKFGEVPQEAMEKSMARQKGDSYAVETVVIARLAFRFGCE